MNKNLIKISTRDMSREDWLEERKKSIGGSEASGIVGLSNYITPYGIWADKTGRTEPKEDNEAMRIGRDLEEYVASRWEEATGKKVRRCNYLMRNPEYPFAHADIDREVVGENAGLECKTTSQLNMKKFKTGEFPEQYYCQCVHYMAVTGADRWYLAVLVLGRGFFEYTLERDEDEIKALMEAERAFFEHIENDTPPEFTGLDPDSETLKVVYKGGSNELVNLYGLDDNIKNLMELKQQKKEIEKSIKYYEQVLQGTLQDNEYGESEHYSVSWKTQVKEPYMTKRSIFRVLRIKAKK